MRIHRSLHFEDVLIPSPRVVVTHLESGRSWGAATLDRPRLADRVFDRLRMSGDAQVTMHRLDEPVAVEILDESDRPVVWRTTLGRLKRWSDGEIRSTDPAPLSAPEP